MLFKKILSLFLLSSFLFGCASSPEEEPASDSPEPVSVSTKESTLMPDTSHLTPETNWWHPTAGLTWQWHINGDEVDTSIEADVYDIDLYAPQSTVDELHA
jgi:hypothetical protein